MKRYALYEVQVTLKVEANSAHQAYGYIKRMIERGNRTGIIHVDSKVVGEEHPIIHDEE